MGVFGNWIKMQIKLHLKLLWVSITEISVELLETSDAIFDLKNVEISDGFPAGFQAFLLCISTEFLSIKMTHKIAIHSGITKATQYIYFISAIKILI
jgi:hypothetical protein